jgi:hypothetical protein
MGEANGTFAPNSVKGRYDLAGCGPRRVTFFCATRLAPFHREQVSGHLQQAILGKGTV